MNTYPLVEAPWKTVEAKITHRVWGTMTHGEWADYVDAQSPIRPTDKTAEVLSTIMGMN